MLKTLTPIIAPQERILSTLSHIRREWQEATDGASLLETDGNIGFLLVDLINGFRLNRDEQVRILGDELFQEMKDFLYRPKTN